MYYELDLYYKLEMDLGLELDLDLEPGLDLFVDGDGLAERTKELREKTEYPAVTSSKGLFCSRRPDE